jgi:gamma-butyrobetaine dioxygenase
MVAEAEVVLERTDDPHQARTLLEKHGACVLLWPSVTKQAVIDAGEAVLGDRLRVRFPAMTLRPHQEPGQTTRIIRPEGTIWEATEATTGHAGEATRARPNSLGIEGWGGHGDTYPEVLAYLCQKEPATGGSSHIVDSYGLLAWLAVTPGHFDLLDALWTLPVPQRTHPRYSPRSTTLARRTRKGRVSVVYSPASVVLDGADKEDMAGVTKMLARWHKVVEESAASAPRFDLRRGEVLLIDNYRVYHGRDAYTGERIVHRCWFWTEAAHAFPMLRQRPAEDLPQARPGTGIG